MKKWMIGIFWSILLLPNILWLFAPPEMKNENIEKRTLASFPVFSWEQLEDYPGEMEKYINDHAAFRNQFLSLNSGINFLLFQSVDSEDVIRGKEGWYFFRVGRSVQDYRGQDLFAPEELAVIGEKVRQVQQYYQERGITFMMLLAPNKESIYREYMPDAFTRLSEVNRYDQVADYLRQETHVPVVAPKKYFLENREWPWYYKTDTHWNDLGSFIALQMMVEVLGGEPVSLEEMDVSAEMWDGGDLPPLCHLPDFLTEDTFYTVHGYYDEVEVNTLDMQADGTVLLTEAANAPDKRRIALYRDSFSYSLMNHIPKYFQYVDSYYYNRFLPEYLDNNVPDVVVYEIVERDLDRIFADMDKLMP